MDTVRKGDTETNMIADKSESHVHLIWSRMNILQYIYV